jgi:hypothetical protein
MILKPAQTTANVAMKTRNVFKMFVGLWAAIAEEKEAIVN